MNKKANVKKMMGLGNQGISAVDFIIIILSTIALIVAGIFLIYHIRENNRLNEEIEIMEQNIEQNQMIVDRYNQWIQDEEQMEQQLAEHQQRIPVIQDIEGIIKDLNHVFSTTRAKSTGIGYGSPQSIGEQTFEIPVNVRMNCTYEQLNRYIEVLNEAERFYLIKSINISNTSQTGILNVELQLSGYYRPN